MSIESAIANANAEGCNLSLRQTSREWEATASRPLPLDRPDPPESPKRYINATGFASSKDLATAIYAATDLCLNKYEILTWTNQTTIGPQAPSLTDLLGLNKRAPGAARITRRI